MEKPAATREPIAPLLASRWSPRAFDPGRAIGAGEIVALLEAARWAPSCFGAQPWSFVVCDRGADSAAWERLHGCLAPGNQAWAGLAPLLILAVGRKDFAHNGKPNRHHLYDTGAASMSLVLQAEALGLRAHQMGGFDPERAREAFGVPDGHDCIAVIAVGHQADPDVLPDPGLRERERAPRGRDPLGERFFAGGWGVPFGD